MSRALPARPILCLVTDRASSRHPLAQAVAAAVRAGADWVQVRERGLEAGELLALVEAVAGAARAARPAVKVLVNRRGDVALAAGADGVHLGFDALDPADARRLLGPGRLIGVSCHTAAEVARARAGGADYAHLAPIFEPFSKSSGRPPLGLAVLREAAAAGLPILAQGGIDARSAAAALEAGAAGVAVTGAILGADDPERAAADLRRALGS